MIYKKYCRGEESSSHIEKKVAFVAPRDRRLGRAGVDIDRSERVRYIFYLRLFYIKSLIIVVYVICMQFRENKSSPYPFGPKIHVRMHCIENLFSQKYPVNISTMYPIE